MHIDEGSACRVCRNTATPPYAKHCIVVASFAMPRMMPLRFVCARK